MFPLVSRVAIYTTDATGCRRAEPAVRPDPDVPLCVCEKPPVAESRFPVAAVVVPIVLVIIIALAAYAAWRWYQRRKEQKQAQQPCVPKHKPSMGRPSVRAFQAVR